MSTLDQARATQLRNIEAKTGKSLAEFRAIIGQCGLTKHSEIRTLLMKEFGLGHGDAENLVHFARQTDGQSAAEATGLSADEVLSAIYTGAKAPLRALHDELLRGIEAMGPFETVPKKGYVSLRRKKQFAMVGPGSKGRLEIGLNLKGIPGTERLVEQPPGGMCQYKVFVSSAGEVDAELLGWVSQAYSSAG